jgi:hypothetical protein
VLLLLLVVGAAGTCRYIRGMPYVKAASLP